MKNKELIINDSLKLDNPPADYNLIETHCFLSLKQLSTLFYNGQISKENATKTKKLILADYEKRCKEYEFEEAMFKEHIDHLKNTEMKRTQLRKMLNGEAEEAKPITEERLCETINVCMEIISTIFPNEFI